jgi:RecA/RadA recombinase
VSLNPAADVLTQLTRKHGPTQEHLLSLACDLHPIGTFPTAISQLDSILGGGLPIGRLTRIFGPPRAGKSALLLAVTRAMQSQGRVGLIVDADSRLDSEMIRRCQVMPEGLIVSSPPYAEAALDLAHDALRTKEIGLVAIDSVSAPFAIAEMGPSHWGSDMPSMLSRALPKLCRLAHINRKLFVLVSQVRARSERGYREIRSRGRALSHYASLSIRLHRHSSFPGARSLPFITKATLVKVRTHSQEGASCLFRLFGDASDSLSDKGGEAHMVATESDPKY